jgi:hypothetical protein
MATHNGTATQDYGTTQNDITTQYGKTPQIDMISDESLCPALEKLESHS